MKAYKGFYKSDDGTLSCLGFVYEPGKTYKHEGEIELCGSGFHACHELWQTWYFYPNNGVNEFWEVECGGNMIESEDGDGKFVCSEIKLVKEIDMSDVAIFDNACLFSEGFAVVELDGKYNFISTDGKLLSEQWFDYTYDFSEGFALVLLNGKYNFISSKGELLSNQWFDNAWSFSEGFANVKLDGKWVKINTRGKTVEE